jgi:MYXO-CTERM domain-containing protein
MRLLPRVVPAAGVAALLLCGAPSEAFGQAITDAGAGTDAAVSADAGVDMDAGVSADAGVAMDAGVSADAGVAMDAGVNADAGAGDVAVIACEAGPDDSGAEGGTGEGGCSGGASDDAGDDSGPAAPVVMGDSGSQCAMGPAGPRTTTGLGGSLLAVVFGLLTLRRRRS